MSNCQAKEDLCHVEKMESDSMNSQRPKHIGGGKGSLFIPVMGVTGSGKSTFISLLADEHVPVSDSLNSCEFSVG